jgi:hypothetical protein
MIGELRIEKDFEGSDCVLKRFEVLLYCTETCGVSLSLSSRPEFQHLLQWYKYFWFLVFLCSRSEFQYICSSDPKFLIFCFSMQLLRISVYLLQWSRVSDFLFFCAVALNFSAFAPMIHNFPIFLFFYAVALNFSTFAPMIHNFLVSYYCMQSPRISLHLLQWSKTFWFLVFQCTHPAIPCIWWSTLSWFYAVKLILDRLLVTSVMCGAVKLFRY